MRPQLFSNAEYANLLHSKARLPWKWNPPQTFLSVKWVWRRFSRDSSVPDD
jgi:hypothetical protein